jgi:hypothetical protein
VIESATSNVLTHTKDGTEVFPDKTSCGIWDSLRGCNSEFSNLKFVAFRLLWNVSTTPTKIVVTSSQGGHRSLAHKRGEKSSTEYFESTHKNISLDMAT